MFIFIGRERNASIIRKNIIFQDNRYNQELRQGFLGAGHDATLSLPLALPFVPQWLQSAPPKALL